MGFIMADSALGEKGRRVRPCTESPPLFQLRYCGCRSFPLFKFFLQVLDTLVARPQIISQPVIGLPELLILVPKPKVFFGDYLQRRFRLISQRWKSKGFRRFFRLIFRRGKVSQVVDPVFPAKLVLDMAGLDAAFLDIIADSKFLRNIQ